MATFSTLKAKMSEKLNLKTPIVSLGFAYQLSQDEFEVDSATGEVKVDPITQKPIAKRLPWVSAWDNDHRFRVTMPEEVYLKVKADKGTNALDTLEYKYELKPAETESVEVLMPDGTKAVETKVIRESYHNFMVIIPTSIDAVL